MSNSDIKLIDIIKISYSDIIDLDEEIEDNDDPSDELELSDDDEDLFDFINEMGEDILFEYLSEMLYVDEKNDTFLDTELINPHLIKIEIQKVEMEDDYIGEPFQREGNLIIANKETSFFKYEIYFNVNSLDDITLKNQELDNIIKRYKESIKLDVKDLFEII